MNSEAVWSVLAAQHPMTVRQVHYALVSRQLTENTPAAYNRLIRVLVLARQEGVVPWEWIEDCLRRRPVGSKSKRNFYLSLTFGAQGSLGLLNRRAFFDTVRGRAMVKNEVPKLVSTIAITE